MRRANRCRGFTLLEVMIALVIIAIAFTAVLRAESVNTHDASYLQDKTIAHWVGLNVINAIQLHVIDAHAPATLNNTSDLLGKVWYWHASVDTTENEDVDSIKVSVSASEESPPLITLTGFMQGHTS